MFSDKFTNTTSRIGAKRKGGVAGKSRDYQDVATLISEAQATMKAFEARRPDLFGSENKRYGDDNDECVSEDESAHDLHAGSNDDAVKDKKKRIESLEAKASALEAKVAELTDANMMLQSQLGFEIPSSKQQNDFEQKTMIERYNTAFRMMMALRSEKQQLIARNTQLTQDRLALESQNCILKDEQANLLIFTVNLQQEHAHLQQEHAHLQQEHANLQQQYKEARDDTAVSRHAEIYGCFGKATRKRNRVGEQPESESQKAVCQQQPQSEQGLLPVVSFPSDEAEFPQFEVAELTGQNFKFC